MQGAYDLFLSAPQTIGQFLDVQDTVAFGGTDRTSRRIAQKISRSRPLFLRGKAANLLKWDPLWFVKQFYLAGDHVAASALAEITARWPYAVYIEHHSKVVSDIRWVASTSITKLVVNSSGLRTLDHHNLSHLTRLHAQNNYKLQDISDIIRLEALTDLDISYCDAPVVWPYVVQCRQLQRVRVRGCGLRNLDGTEALAQLKLLDVSDNHELNNVMGLRGSSVQSLLLTNCGPYDLSVLTSCSNLKNLRLENCYHLRSLEFLVCCTRLRSLDLGKMHLVDVLPVHQCMSLTSLKLCECRRGAPDVRILIRSGLEIKYVV